MPSTPSPASSEKRAGATTGEEKSIRPALFKRKEGRKKHRNSKLRNESIHQLVSHLSDDTPDRTEERERGNQIKKEQIFKMDFSDSLYVLTFLRPLFVPVARSLAIAGWLPTPVRACCTVIATTAMTTTMTGTCTSSAFHHSLSKIELENR